MHRRQTELSRSSPLRKVSGDMFIVEMPETASGYLTMKKMVWTFDHNEFLVRRGRCAEAQVDSTLILSGNYTSPSLRIRTRSTRFQFNLRN